MTNESPFCPFWLAFCCLGDCDATKAEIRRPKEGGITGQINLIYFATISNGICFRCSLGRQRSQIRHNSTVSYITKKFVL